MGRHTNTHMSISRALRVLLSVCLAVGLAPMIALADTTVGVKTEAFSQVNETVVINPDDQDGVEVASGEVTADEQVKQEPINTEVALDLATPKSSQITTDVTLGTTPDTRTETLLVDGLTYLVDYSSLSATLTGWYGNVPTGDLSIPSEITDGKNTFKVQFAGGGTF
ncbi:MAG: hypothetical protein RR672_13905 [Raoultibacter sp.]